MTEESTVAQPPVPRLAATLLLLREAPIEVLMVRRNSRGTFASALVFPGGVHAEEDMAEDWAGLIAWSGEADRERSLRICALRETFEETGVLPLVDPAGQVSAHQPDQPDVPFMEIVRASGMKLPLDQLVHFAHWITPEFAPKRFDTHFYALAAPDCGHARSDGAETVSLEWRAPAGVIASETGLPFPTRLNLLRLTESPTLDHVIEASRMRPRCTVLPRLVEREDGNVVVIPSEAGYSITEEPRGGVRVR